MQKQTISPASIPQQSRELGEANLFSLLVDTSAKSDSSAL